MQMLDELKTLYRLTLAKAGGSTHGERLESFYGAQADGYDSFRRRLLKGRADLYSSPLLHRRGTWVDMGGGTASNLESLGREISKIHDVYVVDLSPSLLAKAQERIERLRWTNVKLVNGDASRFAPPAPADTATFSYSLSMMPDWYAALDNAWRILRPGGRIGVVDFFVSRKFEGEGRQAHGWWTRTFWPIWFAADNVRLSPDILDYLNHRFSALRFEERLVSLPYVSHVFGKVPIFLFVGEKKNARPPRRAKRA